MLLHSTYINVPIAHILVYRKCLYDLPEQSCKIFKLCHDEKGTAPDQGSNECLRSCPLGKLLVVPLRTILA